MTSQQLLESRFAALSNADFAAVYASYHVDAPFLENFPDCSAYVEFAEQQLAAVQVRSWRSLRQRTLATEREEHLLLMELAFAGGSQNFYELALLIKTTEGWRYHSAQKLSQEDYPGEPGHINFCHFDQVSQKIVY